MNCSDFEMNVRALVRTELMDVARREVILGHAVNCLQCSDRLNGEQALIAGVRAVVAELGQQKAPARVGSALLMAFREHNAAAAGSTVVSMPVKAPRHWRLDAVAAAVLIAVSMGAVFWVYSRSPIEKGAALIVSAARVTGDELSNAQAATPVKDDAEISGDVITRRPNRSYSRAVRHRTRATEELTEFFPLMEGIDLDSLEAVQAVRVELPASALNDLGFQTGQDLPTGPVKADVLLGIDGLARAIRFVR
jgi:hypothetical protein